MKQEEMQRQSRIDVIKYRVKRWFYMRFLTPKRACWLSGGITFAVIIALFAGGSGADFTSGLNGAGAGFGMIFGLGFLILLPVLVGQGSKRYIKCKQRLYLDTSP